MDFKQAVITCLRDKYADFKGRAGRAEYWWFFLFQVIVMVILGMVSEMIQGVASLALLLPGLGVGARRLHDIGKSGWFQLLWFIPVIGWGILIYWACQPSGAENEHGAPAEAAAAQIEAPPGAV